MPFMEFGMEWGGRTDEKRMVGEVRAISSRQSAILPRTVRTIDDIGRQEMFKRGKLRLRTERSLIVPLRRWDGVIYHEALREACWVVDAERTEQSSLST